MTTKQETAEYVDHEVVDDAEDVLALVPVPKQTALIEADSADEMVTKATEIATTLKRRVIDEGELFSVIHGRKHVHVEGWVTLGAMLGVTPHEVETVQREDGSFRSTIELRRLSDGMTIGRASAECGGPEETEWQKRPPYARRSMAQTRATGKACRLVFSWIMVLAGYSGTPAEEMDAAAMRDELPQCPECGSRRPFDNREPRKGEPDWVTDARNEGTLPHFRCSNKECKHSWTPAELKWATQEQLDVFAELVDTRVIENEQVAAWAVRVVNGEKRVSYAGMEQAILKFTTFPEKAVVDAIEGKGSVDDAESEKTSENASGDAEDAFPETDYDEDLPF